MRVKVNLFGVIEEVVKEREFSLPREHIVLEEFLEFLVCRYGGDLKEHLLPGGSFSSQYFILVNGRNAELLNGMKAEIYDGDSILICPTLTGG